MTSTIRVGVDPMSWTGYERLRARALGGDVDGWRLGLAVLQQVTTAVDRQEHLVDVPLVAGSGLAARSGRCAH